MVRRFLMLFVASSAACTSLEGQWIGTCEYGDDLYAFDSSVTVKVKDGSGAAVTGNVRLDMFDGRTFNGDMEGSRSESYLEIDAIFRESDGEWGFQAKGDHQEDDSIEGECGLRVPGGTGYLAGELELER
jgi:hypothetical protein